MPIVLTIMTLTFFYMPLAFAQGELDFDNPEKYKDGLFDDPQEKPKKPPVNRFNYKDCDPCQVKKYRNYVADETNPKTRNLVKLEKEIFRMINIEREKENLSKLRYDPNLIKLARLHSLDMLKRRYFSHISPEGESMVGRKNRLLPNIKYQGLGENLYTMNSSDLLRSFRRVARDVVNGWLDSPGHRANMLSKSFNLQAIGVACNGYSVYVTQSLAIK